MISRGVKRPHLPMLREPMPFPQLIFNFCNNKPIYRVLRRCIFAKSIILLLFIATIHFFSSVLIASQYATKIYLPVTKNHSLLTFSGFDKHTTFTPELNDFDFINDQLSRATNNCSDLYRQYIQFERLYGIWYVTYLDERFDKIFVYSAFYDDRDRSSDPPVVTLHAVSSQFKATLMPLYCQIWYRDFEHPVVVTASVHKDGRGHVLDERKYDQIYITCGLMFSWPFPEDVSITITPCAPAPLVPVTVPIRILPVHTFGICVPVTFWYVDPVRIAEWIEAQIMLGVSEINVYYVDLNATTLETLKYYEEKGIVRLRYLPSVPVYEKNRNGVKIASHISINDCLYRNMYRYKWLFVLDFDEIVIPRNVTSYNDLLAQLPTGSPSYIFDIAVFWLDCEKNLQLLPRMSYMLSTWHRTPPAKFLARGKSLPRECRVAFNHYCLSSLTKSTKVVVNQRLALLHHYRDSHPGITGKKECQNLMLNGTWDNTMATYMHLLRDRTLSALREIAVRINSSCENLHDTHSLHACLHQ